jgi:hypothetical protein
MAKKSQPRNDKQIASAFLLSYPQLFGWAVVFALIGGITVWTSDAVSRNNDQTSLMALRVVTDNNSNSLPNWGDTVTFDTSSNVAKVPVLRLTCYQNGQEVYYVQRSYQAGSQAQYMALQSPHWQSGPADCAAALLDSTSAKNSILRTYSFHVDP